MRSETEHLRSIIDDLTESNAKLKAELRAMAFERTHFLAQLARVSNGDLNVSFESRRGESNDELEASLNNAIHLLRSMVQNDERHLPT
jgi:methyl-accepting chemotaxis protein